MLSDSSATPFVLAVCSVPNKTEELRRGVRSACGGGKVDHVWGESQLEWFANFFKGAVGIGRGAINVAAA
ncbi:hypothetical protein Leryth_026347 [Lithospermum erythrorhizon]|nr:hypothetical protein Leryth_026347 [Lithospermum erythrorhizon]